MCVRVSGGMFCLGWGEGRVRLWPSPLLAHPKQELVGMDLGLEAKEGWAGRSEVKWGGSVLRREERPSRFGVDTNPEGSSHRLPPATYPDSVPLQWLSELKPEHQHLQGCEINLHSREGSAAVLYRSQRHSSGRDLGTLCRLQNKVLTGQAMCPATRGSPWFFTDPWWSLTTS